nr:TlpA disulfide reductase family protein [Bacillus piscicola]
MSTEDQATTLELPGLDGDRYSLQSFLDKPLLLTFFTTWCSVCQEELPELSDMYEANEGAWNAVAVNASTQEHNKDAVRKFVQESEIAMPVLVDIGGEGLDTFQVNAVPLSFLIDKDGRIRKKFYGPVSAEQLKKELAKIAGS